MVNYSRIVASSNYIPKLVGFQRRIAYSQVSEKYAESNVRGNTELLAEKNAYYDTMIKIVMSPEGCNHIYTYLMHYEYPHGEWDPEGFPIDDAAKEQLDEISKSLPVEFIETWSWCSLQGIQYTTHIKIKQLMENFAEWRRLHHPTLRTDYKQDRFIEEIKKSKHIEIRKIQGTNMYYSNNIDQRRINEYNADTVIKVEAEIKHIQTLNISDKEKDEKIQRVKLSLEPNILHEI
jgi:hypothetical protein